MGIEEGKVQEIGEVEELTEPSFFRIVILTLLWPASSPIFKERFLFPDAATTT